MKKAIIIAGVLLFIVVSSVIYLKRPQPKHHKAPEFSLIDVEIQGEVVFPGKYRVLEGTTLGELVQFSGGKTNLADTSKINMSEVLKPNHRYQIKRIDQESFNQISYNLNEVDYKTLITIPNITENRALNILLYRKEQGSFTKVEDLLNVKGIGEATFNKIKDYFYIR